ncbi:MAG: hypothetical protein Kow0090_22960 [Myxococcota bacterium]
MKKVSWVMFVILAVGTGYLFFGCGETEDEAGDGGAAPQISDLTFDKSEFDYEEVKGKFLTLNGKFNFSDKDGDASEAEITVTNPLNASQTLPRITVQGISGVTSGPVLFIVQLLPDIAGEWAISVVLYDKKENVSNKLEAKIKIME